MFFKGALFFTLILCVTCFGEDKHPKWAVFPDWHRYYQNTIEEKDPRTTLFYALQFTSREGKQVGFAVDLACGTGRDTLFLLDKGWQVLALDAEKEAVDITVNRCPKEKLNHLRISVSTFADAVIPDQVDLINASWCLHYCDPRDFPALWKNIGNHLAIGGRFCGQFFGDRDEWATIPTRSHQTYRQVLELLADRFEIEYFFTVEDTFPTAGGVMKYWHMFNVVAKKIR